MKNKLLPFMVISIIVLGAIIPTSADVSYAKTAGNVTINSDNLQIDITGNQNVAMYTFRSQSDSNSTKNMVKFKEMFEFTDNNGNGKYDQGTDTKQSGSEVALASLDVALSSVLESSAGNHVSFNMSLSAKLAVSLLLNFKQVTFENNFDSANQTKLKIDVIIDNYQPIKSGNHLAVAYTLTSTSGNQSSQTSGNGNTRFDFGSNAYFEAVNTAQLDSGESVDVGISSNTQGSATTVYMAYSSFTGTLRHDPVIGVTDSGTDTMLPFNAVFSVLAMVAMIPLIRKIRL